MYLRFLDDQSRRESHRLRHRHILLAVVAALEQAREWKLFLLVVDPPLRCYCCYPSCDFAHRLGFLEFVYDTLLISATTCRIAFVTCCRQRFHAFW